MQLGRAPNIAVGAPAASKRSPRKAVGYVSPRRNTPDQMNAGPLSQLAARAGLIRTVWRSAESPGGGHVP